MPEKPKGPAPEPIQVDFGDDDDERTSLSQPGFVPGAPAPRPDGGAISLDDDDDERTQIEKKPGPPR